MDSRTQRTQAGRLARLTVWNRLFRGVPVRLDELDASLLCGDPDWPEDCASYVMLRASVVVSNSARFPIRRALRVAILYWFSNVADPAGGDPPPLKPRRSSFHLREAIGTRLSWDESVAAMDLKPIDYSAYVRVVEVVQEEYAQQWNSLFPGRAPFSIAPLFDPNRETQLGRPWQGAE
jgi:hypothetical protein